MRATLSDISSYEAPPGGYTDRLGFLTPSEQRAEQLCEEERYFSLYNNDVEEEIHQGTINQQYNILCNWYMNLIIFLFRRRIETAT